MKENITENSPETDIEKNISFLFSWHGKRLNELGYNEISIKKALESGKCHIVKGENIMSLVLDSKKYGFTHYKKEELVKRFNSNRFMDIFTTF